MWKLGSGRTHLPLDATASTTKGINMTKKECIDILKKHNFWRRGGKTEMLNPKLIGMAIDKAIKLLEGMK
jgi:hypothetical protein